MLMINSNPSTGGGIEGGWASRLISPCTPQTNPGLNTVQHHKILPYGIVSYVYCIHSYIR